MVCVLKGRLLKNLLVFLRKIEDLTFFSSTLSEQRGKRQKRPFQAPTDPVCKDRACRGLFRQNGLQNRGWIHGYFRIPSDVFGAWFEWPLGTVLHIRIAYKICSQKKNGWNHFHGAAISFHPSFWLYFNERIYEYGDKVKVMILWKSVDFKPQFWWKSV